MVRPSRIRGHGPQIFCTRSHLSKLAQDTAFFPGSFAFFEGAIDGSIPVLGEETIRRDKTNHWLSRLPFRETCSPQSRENGFPARNISMLHAISDGSMSIP
jgi:hypothetical protein